MLAILIILFVLVPLSFMALGKIENPFAFEPISAFADKEELAKRIVDCTNPEQSLEAHVRDAALARDEEESSIESTFYKFIINLEAPVVDWQYTKGVLDDEVASFVYKDVIVNILARTSVSKCSGTAKEVFENFHEETSGVEYFSSNTYLTQGAPIGLTRSTLRSHGQGGVGDADYYWYLLDEEFVNLSSKPIVTIWYSTRVGRIEYWFAFRTFQENEQNLNKVAEEVLEGIEFLKF